MLTRSLILGYLTGMIALSQAPGTEGPPALPPRRRPPPSQQTSSEGPPALPPRRRPPPSQQTSSEGPPALPPRRRPPPSQQTSSEGPPPLPPKLATGRRSPSSPPTPPPTSSASPQTSPPRSPASPQRSPGGQREIGEISNPSDFSHIGHFGQNSMTQLINRYIQWQAIVENLKEFVGGVPPLPDKKDIARLEEAIKERTPDTTRDKSVIGSLLGADLYDAKRLSACRIKLEREIIAMLDGQITLFDAAKKKAEKYFETNAMEVINLQKKIIDDCLA